VSLTVFVIIDPNTNNQAVLSTANRLVREAGGHVHGFCCVYDRDLSQYASRRDAKRTVKNSAVTRLEELIEPLKTDNVSVSSEVVWNENATDMAIQACARSGAELMIVANTGQQKTGKQQQLQLLRGSPCPVLLARTTSNTDYHRVMAAVAIETGNERHDELNNRVIGNAQRIARATHSTLSVVAALQGNPNVAELLKLIAEQEDEQLSNEELISERFGIEVDQVFIDFGSPKQVILEKVKASGADLLVVGTIARTGLSGAVVGNTCEKIVAELPIDLLTVN